MNDTNDNRPQPSSIPGLTIFGCFIVGVAGLIGALFAIGDIQDYQGAGACLIASAIALGCAANAVFRK